MIEIIRTESALAALWDQWSEILPARPSPMSTFEWMRAAARAFYRPGQLYIVALRADDGRLDAVAPLAQTRKGCFSDMSLIGSNFLFEPAGLLFRNAAALNELVLGLIKLGIPINLKRLAHPPEVLKQITNACQGDALSFAKDGPGTPFLPIRTSWKEYEKSISAGRRSDLRRAHRKAEDFGEIDFEIKTPTLKDHQECFEELVNVELNSWKGRIGTAMGADRKYFEFFSEFSRACAQSGSAKFGFMRINDKAIAANFSVEYGRALWTLKVGYDEKYGRCSPGILLTHEMVRYAFEQKLDSFEFLGEPEKWIRLWSPQVMRSPSLRIFPKNARGVSQLGVVVAGVGLRKGKNFTKQSLNFLVGSTGAQAHAPPRVKI